MCQDADTGSRLHSCGGRRDSGYIYDACALYVPYAFKMHGRHKTACVYGFYDVYKGMGENNLVAVMLFITFIMLAVGVFVTAPFLIVAPGVIALSHVYIFRTIFTKYGMKEDEKICQSSL